MGIVEGGRILGRGSSLVGSLEDCKWQELWRQDEDVEGGSRLVPGELLGELLDSVKGQGEWELMRFVEGGI